jgi:hypothetical protein
MARLINVPGLAALLLVSRRAEIESLIDHPLLDRRYVGEGPLVNRWLLSALLRQSRHGSEPLDAFRPRTDAIRAARQAELSGRLDRLAGSEAWPLAPVMEMARYVVEGKGRRRARAALAYATAWPFLAVRAAVDDDSYQPIGHALWRLHRRSVHLRRPLSLTAPVLRLAGGERRTRAAILDRVGGDAYGLHAVEVGLANAAAILERMRAVMQDGAPGTQLLARHLAWAAIRTAPEVVVRQSGPETIALPHVTSRIPPRTVVLLRMRQALRNGDAEAGFEFASGHWSACPARRYVTGLFEAVAETAVDLARGVRRP